MPTKKLITENFGNRKRPRYDCESDADCEKYCRPMKPNSMVGKPFGPFPTATKSLPGATLSTTLDKDIAEQELKWQVRLDGAKSFAFNIPVVTGNASALTMLMWVEPKDGLPDDGKSVMFVTRDRLFLGYYNEPGKTFSGKSANGLVCYDERRRYVKAWAYISVPECFKKGKKGKK